MRVTTAFKRLLRLPGACVSDVSFSAEGVVVTVRLRRRRRVCAECGQTGRQLQIHDRRVKRWRHLDLGASRCLIECELRRLRCRDCGVRLEPVPWARPGAAHTRDFEDVVAWLAQQMAFAPITRLLRIGWHTVGPIVERVVADHLDERRLDGLVCIGVDEICYRRHHRYLTSVADHATGAIVWCAPGRNSATLQALLRRARRPQGLDPGGLDRHERRVPARHPRRRPATPRSALTPSTSSASARAPSTRSAATNGTPTSARTRPHGRWVKSTRWSLLKAPEHQTVRQLATLGEVQHEQPAPLPRLPAARGGSSMPPARRPGGDCLEARILRMTGSRSAAPAPPPPGGKSRGIPHSSTYPPTAIKVGGVADEGQRTGRASRMDAEQQHGGSSPAARRRSVASPWPKDGTGCAA